MCDVGSGPYDASLPFLIQWTAPMAPGPADGPVIEWVSLTPPDPDRLADLLIAVGFVPSRHWPRRVFHGVEGPPSITLNPVGEPEDLGGGVVVDVVGGRGARARARRSPWPSHRAS